MSLRMMKGGRFSVSLRMEGGSQRVLEWREVLSE